MLGGKLCVRPVPDVDTGALAARLVGLGDAAPCGIDGIGCLFDLKTHGETARLVMIRIFVHNIREGADAQGAGAGQADAQAQDGQGQDPVNGRDSAVTIQTMPDRLDSLKWILIGGFAVLFALVYLPAIELEEQHLTEILAGYTEFAARVPLLIPRWPAQFGPDRFSTALYRRNREYQALLGWLVGAAWLVIRSVTKL